MSDKNNWIVKTVAITCIVKRRSGCRRAFRRWGNDIQIKKNNREIQPREEHAKGDAKDVGGDRNRVRAECAFMKPQNSDTERREKEGWKNKIVGDMKYFSYIL